MSRCRYTSLVDKDLLELVDRVSMRTAELMDRGIESRLFKIVQRTDNGDFVAIIEEVRK